MYLSRANRLLKNALSTQECKIVKKKKNAFQGGLKAALIYLIKLYNYKLTGLGYFCDGLVGVLQP